MHNGTENVSFNSLSNAANLWRLSKQSDAWRFQMAYSKAKKGWPSQMVYYLYAADATRRALKKNQAAHQVMS